MADPGDKPVRCIDNNAATTTERASPIKDVGNDFNKQYTTHQNTDIGNKVIKYN